MNRTAFTLIELIFVIVIIGVLAGVAVPKFQGLSSNSKVAAELATASTIQSAVDDAHSEWVISEGSFKWGSKTSDCPSDTNDFNCTSGYPEKLGEDSDNSFSYILKSAGIVDAKWTSSDNDGYEGPASQADSGVNNSPTGKPDATKHWDYNSSNGVFSLEDD